MKTEYKQPFYSPFVSHKDKKLTKLVAKIFPNASRRLRRNIRMYIINFLIWGKVAAPRGKEWFVKKVKSKWHTHYLAVKAQDTLAQAGFAIIWKGYRNKTEYEQGYSSTLTPTDKSYKVFGDKLSLSTIEIDTSEIPDIEIPTKNWCKKWFSKYKQDLPYTYHPNTLNNLSRYTLDTIPTALRTSKHLRLLLKTTGIINAHLKKVKVGLKVPFEKPILGNVHFTKILTDELNGRFFQKGGLSYLELPREFRKENVLIDGSSTLEVDFIAIHINLLYIKIGKRPIGEAYMSIVEKLIGKPDAVLRDVVKRMMLVIINCKDFQEFSRAMNKPRKDRQPSEERKLVLKLKEYKKNLHDVVKAVKEAHPDLVQFLLSGRCIGRELMFHDSNIIAKILLRLFSEGIIALPLHDSIICKEGDEEIVRRVMLEESKSYTGFEIPVKINKPNIATQTSSDVENVSKIETELSQKCGKASIVVKAL